jgi:allophanate hydrolase subunit 2
MSLVIEQAAGPISIQDLGRPGHMHEGVPPGGAAVRALLVAANREAANRDDAAVLEVFGLLKVRAERRVEVATPNGACILDAGESMTVSSVSWTYLAVRGGIAAPEVLGGRGALPGVLVRKGDRIEPAGEAPVRFGRPPVLTEGPVRVQPGPDLDAFAPDALAVLCSAPYRMINAHRAGANLTGSRIPRIQGWRERSRPMVKGAIEVPGAGFPIVLGPDHPTTGGYPILAVVMTEDLDRVFATETAGEVQFKM